MQSAPSHPGLRIAVVLAHVAAKLVVRHAQSTMPTFVDEEHVNACGDDTDAGYGFDDANDCIRIRSRSEPNRGKRGSHSERAARDAARRIDPDRRRQAQPKCERTHYDSARLRERRKHGACSPASGHDNDDSPECDGKSRRLAGS
jgi:hypothetical protein